MTPIPLLDWTEGAAGLVFQACPSCDHVWYFHRAFCPRCGHTAPRSCQASGRGVVHAVTRVARAPSEALRPYAPYALALVDLDEGVRVMAHVEEGAGIGDTVIAEFVNFGERLIPRFRPVSPR